MNDTTGSTHKLEHSFRITAASVYLILLLLVLCLNLFQLLVYIKGREKFKSMAFFTITWQLVINDLIQVNVYIIFSITILLPSQPIISSYWQNLLSSIESFSHNNLLSFAFLLSLNRLTVFTAPKLAVFLNRKGILYGFIIAIWVLVGLLNIGILLGACPMHIDVEELTFKPACPNAENYCNHINQYYSTIIPLLMTIVYALIFLEITLGIFGKSYCCLLTKHRLTHSHKEKQFFLQSFLIGGAFIVQTFVHTIIYLPYVETPLKRNQEILFIIKSLSTVLLISVDAIVVLSMNSIAKEVVKEIFDWKQTNICYIPHKIFGHQNESTEDLQSISIKF